MVDEKSIILYNIAFLLTAPVAQLDRALDYGSKGWGFDSLQARISISKS